MSLKLVFISLFLLIAIGAVAQQPPDTVWTRTYGGASPDMGYCVKQTDDGGYIISGYSGSFGALSYDAYLIKTDALGTLQWSRIFGGTGWDEGRSVLQTTDGSYVVAGVYDLFGYPDVYLIKVDGSGNPVWMHIYGLPNNAEQAYGVLQTSDGGYLLVGSANVNGVPKVLLLKTDAFGTAIWNKFYGPNPTNLGSGIQPTQDGGYIVVGTSGAWPNYNVYLIKTDGSGDSTWTKVIDMNSTDYGSSVQQTQDLGYIVTGYSFSGQWYLIKTDAQGDTSWTRRFAGRYCYDVKQTTDGGYVLVGSTYLAGVNDQILIIKTDAQGDTIWTKTLGGNESDIAQSVVLTADGGYAVAGSTSSYGAGSYDVYLVKLEENGPPTPVVLQSFSAAASAKGIELTWRTASENECYGWKVERAEAESDFAVISPLISGFGTSIEPHEYSYTDLTAQPGTAYNYRLQQLDLGGKVTWYDPISASTQSIPSEFILQGAFPNPFNPTTAINYKLQAASNVSVKVYDTAGRLLQTLADGWQAVGDHRVIFAGLGFTSGVYLYQLEVGGQTIVGKLVLLK